MLKKYQKHFGQFANILPYDIYWTLFMIVLKVKVKNIFTILHQMINQQHLLFPQQKQFMKYQKKTKK